MQPQEVTEHLPLVHQIARQMAARAPVRVDLDDLVGAGTVGLLEAAQRYDQARGVSFVDFARRRVKGAMIDALRATAPSSRRSRRQRRELEACRQELAHRLGREPEPEEVAEYLGIDLAELGAREQRAAGPRVLSLDELGLGHGEQSLVAEALRTQEVSAEARLALDEARRRVAEAVETLGERQRLVLSLYYVEELKLREIGEILGVSESRVCQIHTSALRQLRDRLTQHDPLH